MSYRVDFFIVGAQRCGTTFLSSALARLPQVAFSRVKEPFFFTETDDWKANLSSYHELFAFEDSAVSGEASTHYTMTPKYRPVFRDIFQYNPDAKIIYLMRNPVDRAVSLYTYYEGGVPSANRFEDAFSSDLEYVCAGMYHRQIHPYLDLFGRDNVRLIVFEDMVDDVSATLLDTAAFLGVDVASGDFETGRENQSEDNFASSSRWIRKLYDVYGRSGVHDLLPSSVVELAKKYLVSTSEKPDVSASLKRRLSLFFEEDVSAMEDLLGRTLDEWRYR